MARKVQVTGEVSTETNTGFKPLKAGKYEVTVFGVEEGAYKNGANKGKPNLNVQYRISEGQSGANRRVFDLVPLITNWSDGKDAFRFFQFFAAVQGISEKDFRIKVKEAKEAGDTNLETLDLPDDDDLLGMELTITLNVKDDDYRYKEAVKKWKAEGERGDEPKQADFQRNNITAVSGPGEGNMESDDADSGSSGGGSTGGKVKATVLAL